MDIQLQVQTIQLLVNESPTADDARSRYAGLEGVLLPKEVADATFNEALNKKFASRDKVQARILKLEKQLRT